MTVHSSVALQPAQSLPVYSAACFTAVDGANLGDPMSIADDLILGDSYQLLADVDRVRLAIGHLADQKQMVIALQSETGMPGAELHLDCVATFMSTDGTLVEIVVVVEMNRDRCTIAQVHLFPLSPLQARREYTLVRIDRDAAAARFAEAACVSFTRGTHIAMSNGCQTPIEALKVGDLVLTRDHGPQKIRWIGRQTVRASGVFAPIRIAKGVLNNENDLIVSPNHRLFVYQRQDHLRAGRAEVLIKAKHLLNGTSVTRTDGGFVDYFQLLFDRHEIIYAEGIAAETLLVDTRTRSALPAELGARMTESDTHAKEYVIPPGAGAVIVDQLRRASAC
ncbi:Hint domain-containing protein [Maribius pontilimi]|uniref:Hint domain-containing protein n=1 Tax=Palleronia pontilimi TaxID=1964209 RepID=A0A934IDB4_9RHOB|nr:Hint domain-containing protein [Palleronia pontilimi]MBJ3763551.1 Hint domain-containing protein [Palleronia pontilimi]